MDSSLADSEVESPGDKRETHTSCGMAAADMAKSLVQRASAADQSGLKDGGRRQDLKRTRVRAIIGGRMGRSEPTRDLREPISTRASSFCTTRDCHGPALFHYKKTRQLRLLRTRHSRQFAAHSSSPQFTPFNIPQ
jgi:hypothetical protein